MDVPWREDNLLELRAGACLLRNVGPTTRCNYIRVNLDKHTRVGEHEPYSTLSSFRMVPGLGVVFGQFYQMEILSSNRLWNKILPKRLGYQTFEEAIKSNPVEKREADGEFYVRIYKKDGLMVRHE